MPQTLAQLRAEAQQRSNQENMTLVSTSEWARYINEAADELYDLVLAANPHYYVSSQSFTLSSSNAFDLTSLSSGFYKLKGVDYLPSGPQYPVTVKPMSFLERNRFWNQNYAGTYTIWWTPPRVKLVNDSDQLDYILDVWSEFIANRAAIPAALKEESHELAAGLAEVNKTIATRVQNSAVNRVSEPEQAADLSEGLHRGDSGRRFLVEGSNLLILGSANTYWGF